MRRFDLPHLLWLLTGWTLGCLHGAESLKVLAVERKGLPPFDPAERIYKIEGGLSKGLKAGHRLSLRRDPNGPALAWLEVEESYPDFARAKLLPHWESYPLRGDLLLTQELPPNPPPKLNHDTLKPARTLSPKGLSTQAPRDPLSLQLRNLGTGPEQPSLPKPLPPTPHEGRDQPSHSSAAKIPAETYLAASSPRSVGNGSPSPTPEAGNQWTSALPGEPIQEKELPSVTQRGTLYFLPKDSQLSPKGKEKLSLWVRTWGAQGSYRLGIPRIEGQSEKLQKARAQTLKTSLKELGVLSCFEASIPPHPQERPDFIVVEKIQEKAH